MTSRPTFPNPGSRPGRSGPSSMMGLLGNLSITAFKQDSMFGGAGGIVGNYGSYFNSPFGTSMALFQLISNFTNDDLPDGYTNDSISDSPPWNSPSQKWWHADAERVDYYSQTTGDWDTQPSQPEQWIVWCPAGLQVDSEDACRNLPSDMQSANVFQPPASCGQWVWCYYDERISCWCVMQPAMDEVRGKLTDNLYSCDSAGAMLKTIDPDSGDAQYKVSFTVWDDEGIVGNQILQEFDDAGNSYIPAGTCFYAKFYPDASSPCTGGQSDSDSSGSGCTGGGRWEVQSFGDCCNETSGSESGSEESGSEESGSEESGSEGSGSESSSSGSEPCILLPDFLTSLPGYDPSQIQTLSHKYGCGSWINVEPCSSGS